MSHYMTINQFYRIARMDGVAILAATLGLFASPYVYDFGGYYLSCGLTIALNVAALVHMTFFVKDFKMSDKSNKKDTNLNGLTDKKGQDYAREPFLKKYLWLSLKESFVTLTRKRPGNLRLL